MFASVAFVWVRVRINMGQLRESWKLIGLSRGLGHGSVLVLPRLDHGMATPIAAAWMRQSHGVALASPQRGRVSFTVRSCC